MATHVLTGAVITVGGVDFSDHADSVTLTETAADQDFTNFGSAGWSERKAGLKSWSLAINFQQDYAASEVDVTLAASAGALVGVTVKPTTAAVGATNPNWSGSVLVTELPHVGGAVGDAHKFGVTWPGSGTLSRLTS